MSLQNAIIKARETAISRGWDKIFVAIDLHDTIIPSSYVLENTLSFYNGAKGALQMMSADPEVCLILFTSSFPENLKSVYKLFEENHINFEYFNCNPEVANTDNGNFTDKFYYNVLLEDKAGFDPAQDWFVVTESFNLPIKSN